MSKGNGRLAQLGEHLPYKQGVIGSSPITTTIFLVEQGTENPRVSGSIPLEATNSFMVDVAQLVRAPVCGTGGREFESHLPPHYFPPENNIGL